ncbi:hypothetical protein LMG18091_02855 [Ralstonia wenshanensis]|uniref:Uncharacterized protein n=1 Tax=Ralstonia wenshanensis TaxID=2842456 RepID=A0AAD2EQ79_9RALS|nr:hypothetical protein LMG18091_02855 [Ralstonia wenshanensis]
MKQTTFWRAKVDRIRLWVGEGGELLPISRIGCPVCPSLWTGPCSLRQASDLGGRCFAEGCREKGCQAHVAASFASHHDARSRAHRATSGSGNFPPLLTRQQHDVTLTLQACNAKKNFSRKSPCVPSDIREWHCNACQSTPIFRQNASVSYAVKAPNDCMMLNRNGSLHFSFPLGFSGVAVRDATRFQSALQLTAVDRGAS